MGIMVKDIVEQINNNIYNAEGDIWWQPDSPLYLIKCCVNPVRMEYFKKKLFAEMKMNPLGKSALEVGCGGGLLCEEIAHMGFNVNGIDPSEHSLRIAASHAIANNLRISYTKGTGEILPYQNHSMDIIFCCDVLEHVQDVPKVISEISRVLKPGGFFFYDTFNRTFLSKLVAIKIAQVWKLWAFAPKDIHVWKMFIKPDELKSLMGQNNLGWKENTGMQPNVRFLKLLGILRKRAKGELTYKDLGKELFMVESSKMSIMYMGFAQKK